MDTLTAIVELVRVLAWPIVTVTLVYILRNTIAELIGSLKEATLKYKDLELALSRDLKAAKSSLEAAGGVSPENKIEANPSTDDLIALAQVSPHAAIIESWIRVESAAASLAIRKGMKTQNPDRKGINVIKDLIRHPNLIPQEVAHAILKLRDIRNRTAHTLEFQPAVDDAEEYVVLASAAIADLDST